MNKGLNDKKFIFGILGSKKRAISIDRFRKVTDKNGEFVSVTHDDCANTNIMVANVNLVYTDNIGDFLSIPSGHIAFEVPENFDNINEDNSFELANRFLEEHEINSDKNVYYVGTINY